jgi:hypothetical protein
MTWADEPSIECAVYLVSRLTIACGARRQLIKASALQRGLPKEQWALDALPRPLWATTWAVAAFLRNGKVNGPPQESKPRPTASLALPLR